ncbi:MAG: imidazole glycerol phosphate synthase subunit HisH [Desulfobacteraceae bacterium]|nr:MAG: imidazole glycerol phosphate synthase subunit HisH [Desulfobacteraceae bacterium]
MITIIDSGIANIGSVRRAIERIGEPTAVAKAPGVIESASALILPGVGSFADGMESLRRLNLIEPIRRAAGAGVPILGICLGMQLLAESGQEFGQHEGLGLVPGCVVRLQPLLAGERVPNIGWCDVSLVRKSRLFCGIDDDTAFYFMHSYHLQCADPSQTVGTIAFGAGTACAAVEAGNLFGVQFHPEKSQDFGLQILHNFILQAKRQGGLTHASVRL